MLVVILSLIFLFATCAYSQAYGKSVACIARCKTDGSFLEVWSGIDGGCRVRVNGETAEEACHNAFAWEKGPFCGEKGDSNWRKQYADPAYPALLNYVEFEDLDVCNDYYKNAITAVVSSNSSLSKTASDIKEAQCGCTDMVSSILKEGKNEMLQGSTFCSAVMGHLSIGSRACRLSSKIPLVNVVCENLLGVVDGALNKAVFEPVCGLILRLTQEITGLDIESLYSRIDFEQITDKVSKRTCGTLTCNKELSDVCIKVDFGLSMSSAKVLESISDSHCRSTSKSTGHLNSCNMIISGISATGVMLARL